MLKFKFFPFDNFEITISYIDILRSAHTRGLVPCSVYTKEIVAGTSPLKKINLGRFN